MRGCQTSGRYVSSSEMQATIKMGRFTHAQSPKGTKSGKGSRYIAHLPCMLEPNGWIWGCQVSLVEAYWPSHMSEPNVWNWGCHVSLVETYWPPHIICMATCDTWGLGWSLLTITHVCVNLRMSHQVWLKPTDHHTSEPNGWNWGCHVKSGWSLLTTPYYMHGNLPYTRVFSFHFNPIIFWFNFQLWYVYMSVKMKLNMYVCGGGWGV